MIITLWACSETILQDSQTNVVSLINVVDEISSPSFPIILPKFSLVALAKREIEEDNNPQLRAIATLNNEPLFQTEFILSFLDKTRARAVIVVQGIIIPGPGTVRVSLFSPQAELAFWEIIVTATGQPQVDLFNPAPAPAA